MDPIIKSVERRLILEELTPDKLIRKTRKGENEIYALTASDSPNTMKEIGRLREVSFRMAGGGTGKSVDIDEYDIDPEHPYTQLIVWDPKDEEILGGYRYILCGGIDPERLATRELFNYSEDFIKSYLPYTIELGRSFIQPNYQGTNIKRKGLFALDNLWDGLGALVMKYSGYRYFFGKVTMYTSYNSKARNTLLYFLNKYFSDPENLVTPISPLDYDGNNPAFVEIFDNVEYKDAYKLLSKEIRETGESIPPLINSYMNLSPSMRVFGTAINDEFGGVEETGILVSIQDIYPEKIERHVKPISALLSRAKNFRPKWWRQE